MEYNITHFAIVANDVHKSVEFYKNMFDFKVDDESSDWAELSIEGGPELAIKKRFKGESVGSSGLGFAVSDCRKATDALKNRGAKILKNCELREDGIYLLTQIKDPDGDIIWLTQRTK